MKKKREGLHADPRYLEGSGAIRSRGGREKRPMKIAFSARRQTLEEEQKCNAAIENLLSEMIGQQLAARDKK